ncbi:hypothetical protein E2C01_020216 [Portunus trituberculatus]|uniref:Uncharacterized protein n=1 Tax=Portunus trituberculatus TaxID=210409 RepID=A0A5B7DZ78_PORTR|nr:hypothetical protein [Portunus trituberculatus]
MVTVFTIMILPHKFPSCIKSPTSKQNEYGNAS